MFHTSVYYDYNTSILVLMTVMRIIMQIFQYMIYILNFSFNKNSEARFQTSGVQWTSSQYVCVMKVQRRILIQRNVIMFIYSRKIWVISVRGNPSPSSYYFYAQSPWLKCLIMVLLILKYLSFSYSSYVCLMLFRF